MRADPSRHLCSVRTPSRQATGFADVDRTLTALEQRIAEEHAWPDLRGPPTQFVKDLLPAGSLSVIGGPWQRYDPSATAVAPPLFRPKLERPPRFGFPKGFESRSGVYY